MTKILFNFLFLVLLPTIHGFAQTIFVEGTIEYSIELKDNLNQINVRGTYQVAIKDNLIRKELRLENGYENIILINNNTKTIYSLNKLDQNNFAVQLSFNDYMENCKKYQDFILINGNESKSIANYNAKKFEIKYKNEPISFVYYDEQLQLETTNIFERFSGLKFVPLSFEINNHNGTNMFFEAKLVEIKPMVSSLFVIPSGYKIISKNEFDELRK